MKFPRSLQARLGWSLGILLTLLWIAGASLTAVILRYEMDEVFDSALQETAQRILPLAVTEIVGRQDGGKTQRLAAIREHNEFYTYVVRDADGRILLQSHTADPADFPAYDGPGFRETATHRLYNDDALQGTVRISVAESLDHRATVAREIQMGLVLPLLIIVPIALIIIALAVRTSLAALRRFRQRIEARDSRDLSPVSADNLPSDIMPLATTINGLLDRLKEAFDAERSFAANAAHELRTPLAGAIAHAQRLRLETTDPAAAARAADIEVILKRLTHLSERLMQLARAEGGQLQLGQNADLGMMTRIVVEEIARTTQAGRITATLPEQQVMSDLDPDIFGILCRNLIENALRHGAQTDPVEVCLTPDGILTVSNEGPVVPSEVLARLTTRFERAGTRAEGSGLGLAIVAAIAARINSRLDLTSPRPGGNAGFEASLKLPVQSTR